MELEWRGKDVQEKGILIKLNGKTNDKIKTGSTLVEVDANYFRPTEVDVLIGDAAKARQKLNWIPRVKFAELVKIMTVADWEKVQRRGF
jgi:GDPmannose 4,6-dehydratase